MSNWYTTSDTWFSANEVGAWTPSVTAIPSGSSTIKNVKPSVTTKTIKQLPNDTNKAWPETKQIKTKKISENEISNPPQTTIKFHELPSNTATHQGAWDAYVVTEESQQEDDLSPRLPSHITDEFGGWDTTQIIKEELGGQNFQKPKRNCDIEAELNRQNLYKTELCLSWAETGACRYGAKCQFAHGKHELRPVLRHPKYKTEICKTFNTTGQCPYGKRCRFVHQLNELRAPTETSGLEQEIPVAEEDETTAEIQRKLNELNLSLLAPDPVFPVPGPEVLGSTTVQQPKKGSRLPFFQKLRKQKW